ncbi:MAG: hypothetical protein PHW82_17530 [Bacteroidales bacterium]|nr:hypothetical protein [Bacteroidales bacterium]
MEKENFLLQNIAEKIAVGDNPEYKNGWLISLFGGIFTGFLISYILLYVIIRNDDYYSLFFPLQILISVIYFFLVKRDIAEGKKGLVAESIYNDLYYLKNSFSSKFDSSYESISFTVENFVIRFSNTGGFRVAYFEKIDSLENFDEDSILAFFIKYYLEIDKIIVEHNTGTFSNKENGAILLIVNNYYFIENLLKHRKKLRHPRQRIRHWI